MNPRPSVSFTSVTLTFAASTVATSADTTHRRDVDFIWRFSALVFKDDVDRNASDEAFCAAEIVKLILLVCVGVVACEIKCGTGRLIRKRVVLSLFFPFARKKDHKKRGGLDAFRGAERVHVVKALLFPPPPPPPFFFSFFVCFIPPPPPPFLFVFFFFVVVALSFVSHQSFFGFFVYLLSLSPSFSSSSSLLCVVVEIISLSLFFQFVKENFFFLPLFFPPTKFFQKKKIKKKRKSK